MSASQHLELESTATSTATATAGRGERDGIGGERGWPLYFKRVAEIAGS